MRTVIAGMLLSVALAAGAQPGLRIRGTADLLVPYRQSELLEAALRQAGVRVRLVAIPDGPHGGETAARGLPTALDFLTEVFGTAGARQ